MLNDETRGVDEAYQVAGTSSNLRVEAERRGDADVLIAAGWTPGMLGGAALRLRTEWDCIEKPRAGQDMKQEAMHLSRKLKSFAAVKEALSFYMGDAAMAQGVIFWWLDQSCRRCGGTKFETVAGTNRHSAKICKPCQGTGLAHIPHGQEGRKGANFLDDAVQIARTSIKKRLRPSQNIA